MSSIRLWSGIDSTAPDQQTGVKAYDKNMLAMEKGLIGVVKQLWVRLTCIELSTKGGPTYWVNKNSMSKFLERNRESLGEVDTIANDLSKFPNEKAWNIVKTNISPVAEYFETESHEALKSVVQTVLQESPIGQHSASNKLYKAITGKGMPLERLSNESDVFFKKLIPERVEYIIDLIEKQGANKLASMQVLKEHGWTGADVLINKTQLTKETAQKYLRLCGADVSKVNLETFLSLWNADGHHGLADNTQRALLLYAQGKLPDEMKAYIKANYF